jgi:predicted component of type VI protein secretion system
MSKALKKHTEKSWSERLAKTAAMSPEERSAAVLRGMRKRSAKASQPAYKLPI